MMQSSTFDIVYFFWIGQIGFLQRHSEKTELSSSGFLDNLSVYPSFFFVKSEEISPSISNK